jgi:hypothetical protein
VASILLENESAVASEHVGLIEGPDHLLHDVQIPKSFRDAWSATLSGTRLLK